MENSLKRPLEPSGPDEDQENLDPTRLPPAKKNKSGLEDTMKTKPPPFIFRNGVGKTAAPSTRPKQPLRKPSRYVPVSKPPPTVSTSAPTRAETARVPAGRSPVKRQGMKSYRRKVYGINPPSLSTGGGNTAALPFSLDAAVAGTLDSYTPAAETKAEIKDEIKDTTMEEIKLPLPLNTSIPASWQFAIYEETELEQKDTIFAHSTNILDISDDEGLVAKDRRGKENIPPADHGAPMVPASRRHKTDGVPRTPLDDLDPARFYPDGVDATSHVLVPDEKDEL